MVEALPLEERLASLDVELLDDPLHRHAASGAADGGEIPWHRVVDRDQCGVLRADEELVVVSVVAVGSADPCYLAVGMVEDHVLAWHGFDPRKDGLSPVALHLEVHRPPM